MADSFLRNLQRVMTGGGLGFVLPAPAYLQAAQFAGGAQVIAPAATITPTALGAEWIKITFAANTVAVLQIPANVPAGQAWMFVVTIINTSGGNLTNFTLAAAYKAAALTLPTTGNNRSFVFMTDGTNAYEIVQTAADVGN